MNARAAWLAYLAVGVAADVWRKPKRDGTTLSQTTRDVFRTETPLGRAAFIVAWGALGSWFSAHVLEHPADLEQREIDADFARLAGK